MKRLAGAGAVAGAVSLPSRERELKRVVAQLVNQGRLVAPLAGARIETTALTVRASTLSVAPLAGARIETGAR